MTTRHGDFSGLADDYAKYRPDYSPLVLRALTSLTQRPFSECDAADVGAGTGIWTGMVASLRPRSLTAVEPNDEMRSHGQTLTAARGVRWLAGSGEATGLESASVDFLSMASSFHWVQFEKGLDEFCRVLRPGGVFAALWNPRYIEANPLLVEIEEHLRGLKPQLQRVSSGRTGITDTLYERLQQSGRFADVGYFEARHVIRMSHERYLGAWRSVNDLRVQLGDAKFDEFVAWVERRISSEGPIEATYLTRAWVGRRP